MSQPGNGGNSTQGPVGTWATDTDGAELSPQQREAMYQAQGAAMDGPLGALGMGELIAHARASGMNEQQIQQLAKDAEVLQGLSGSNQDYQGRQHAELKGFVTTNLDPGQVNQMSEIFSKIRGVLDRLSQRTNESVGKARHEWEGDAAENAFGYFNQMSTWADSNATNAQLASEATYAQSNAAESAKNSMPEPVETNGLMKDFGSAVKDNPLNPIGAFNQAMETREKADAAHQEAVQVMNTYDQNLYQAASKQPAFSQPPTFSAGAGDKGGIGGGSGVIDIPGGPSDSTSAAGYSGGPSGGPSVPGGGGPGNVSSLPGGGGGTPPGVAPAPMPGRATGQGQLPGTGPAANTPAARMPAPGAGPGGSGFGPMGPVGPMGGSTAGGSTPYSSKLGRPAAAGGFGPTGGGSGSAAGAAKGMGAGAAGGAAGPGGASGAAKPGMGGAAPGAAAAAGGAGARGGAGGGMMGGAGAGRGNQQGGEDEEHQRPSWLVEADPDSLFGTDERTAPPVIGE